uniref:Actin-related protein 2/3 complex subunit n=1 Tax=Arcella intermedia TaxID=1963864 RepID=A0A6B2L7U9_9EUKA
MTANLQRLAVCISAHAWNADRSKVALCPNNSEVRIYTRKGNDFELETTLHEHDSLVTGIDWGKTTNRIVSCSQDRNAYVWNFDKEKNTWKPTLVILRINRAATNVFWSPKEDKFAVGSGAKCLCVCYFEPDNNWWISKHFKQDVESTITCVAWHPNNILLAAGGTDNVVRVVSGFVQGIDNRKDVAGGTPFGSKLPFGTLAATFRTNAWVKSIKWSPSGNRLAWVSQDSVTHVLECADTNHKHIQIPTPLLPFQDLEWVDENRFVAVGHDANPTLFAFAGGAWKLDRQLDVKKGSGAKGGADAKKFFQDKAALGSEEGGADRDLDTHHQNCITVVRKLDDSTYSTTGLDGNLAIWPAAAWAL